MKRLIIILQVVTLLVAQPTHAIWLSVDPLVDKYPSISPYAYCTWNPLKYVDHEGKRPIYSTDGELLGTDDSGIQGQAIVMDSKLFRQGMPQEIASAFDIGDSFLSDDAFKKFSDNYNSLSSRPDWDGYLTIEEANNWYRAGGGNPLYVDASKVDISTLKKSDFLKVGTPIDINFFAPKHFNLKTGIVYGTIQVTLINNKGAVRLGNESNLLDFYNFDMQEGRFWRNCATRIGAWVAGKGVPFNIYYYGHGQLK